MKIELKEGQDKFVVLNARVARILVQKNYRIIDLKPHKENRQKTVFVFKADDENFERDLNLAFLGEY